IDPSGHPAANTSTEQAYGDFLPNELARIEVLVLLAEEAGAVTGYTYSALEGMDFTALRGPAGVVYDLIVDASRRRAGIGRSLLETTVAFLVERGAPTSSARTWRRSSGRCGTPDKTACPSAAIRRRTTTCSETPAAPTGRNQGCRAGRVEKSCV